MKKKPRYGVRITFHAETGEQLSYEVFELFSTNANYHVVQPLIYYSYISRRKDIFDPKRWPRRNITTSPIYTLGQFRYSVALYSSMEELMEHHFLDLI